MQTKTLIFLGDGMADEPIKELNGKTPLQAAHTPAMDRIAREGVSGTLHTLPEGFPTSSDVANMSVLGCHIPTDYCGRGPLEAAGQGIALAPDEVAFRLNLTTERDGILTDYSGGHLAQEHANELIALLNKAFGSERVRIESGVSYRNLLILSGPEFTPAVVTAKPDDNQGNRVDDHLPHADAPEAQETLQLLLKIIREAPAVMRQSAVNQALLAKGQPLLTNGVWPCLGGHAANLTTLKSKYDVENSAVISAVDVVIGLGRCLGMTVITVPGATGYIDTNYEGKADAAIHALDTNDFVYLHVEAIDEVSHEQRLDLKLQAIEDFDRRVVARVLDSISDDVNVAVLPDHPVPLSTGKHTRTPVPVSVRLKGRTADTVQSFDEAACPTGELGAMANGDLMALLLGAPRV
ncbi:MAG: cofactor-independent phosphoglycerate mutase [Kiritimatiellae bacterium]|nr:cofactor-independent phosphoglycerate mutase [Kiritimatiellia bacterium]